ncbi:MAG: sigma-54 dependent transcriptional regulator [Vicinamibacterales bacterium]
MTRLLLVDDDAETCRFLADLLEAPGRAFTAARSAAEATAHVRTHAVDVLITDLHLGSGATGLDVLRAFNEAHPGGRGILISAFGSLETAIEAGRAGAFDFISKPFDIGDMRDGVRRAIEQATPVEAEGPRPAPAPVPVPGDMIGRSAPMLEVYKQIARAADTDALVLIVGESGTGKELVARAIHAHGRRVREPFVAVNCGAIPETLLESELFGHVRGAFTGAASDRAGVFIEAGHGTVFLDEIGETSRAVQVRLLRVLEQGDLRPVGASRSVTSHARVIAATNADLERAVREGRFRQDLYFRLGVGVIRMPPLRERRADVPLFIAQFLAEASARLGRPAQLSPDALDALLRHSWPGNVRQLRHVLERAVLFGRGDRIERSDLRLSDDGAPDDAPGPEPALPAGLFAGGAPLPTLDEVERRYLGHVLKAVGGNRSRAAEVLGIDRRTLYRMAERFDLSDQDLGGAGQP